MNRRTRRDQCRHDKDSDGFLPIPVEHGNVESLLRVCDALQQQTNIGSTCLCFVVLQAQCDPSRLFIA